MKRALREGGYAKVKVGQGSARTLAERSTTHAEMAGAEGSLAAAEALFHGAIDTAWDAAQPDLAQTRLTAALTRARTLAYL